MQVRRFLQNTAQLCLKAVLKFVFLSDFLLCATLIGALYAIFVRRTGMYLRTCRSFKSANRKEYWVRKSQIRKRSDLRKVRKYKNYWSLPISGTYLRIAQLCIQAYILKWSSVSEKKCALIGIEVVVWCAPAISLGLSNISALRGGNTAAHPAQYILHIALPPSGSRWRWAMPSSGYCWINICQSPPNIWIQVKMVTLSSGYC